MNKTLFGGSEFKKKTKAKIKSQENVTYKLYSHFTELATFLEFVNRFQKRFYSCIAVIL